MNITASGAEQARRTSKSSAARRRLLFGAVAAFALVGAACASDDDSAESAATTAAPATTNVAATIPDTTAAPDTTEPPPPPEEPFDISLASLVGNPSETNSLNGVSVSPVDGNVYVASVGGSEITIHDPETGEVVDRLGPDQGVNGPDDVFVADDGTVYWTDLLQGNVGMIAPGGEVKTQSIGQGANPITISDDGRLFAGRLFLGEGLYELDPMLETDPVPVGDIVGLNAFDFGPDGLLYAPSFFTGEVVRLDVDAATPVAEVIASGFAVPSAVKFNSAGEAYVADLAEGKVFKLDLVGGEHEELLDIDGTIDNIAFDADDRLFVVAGSDNQIIRIDDDGTTVLGDAGLGLPGGVAVSPDGTIWVADFFAMRGFDPTDLSTWSTSFYDRSAPPGESFAGAGTVSADADTLILSNAFSGAVQVLEPATGEILTDIRDVILPLNAIQHGDRLVAAQAGGSNVVDANDPTTVLLADLGLPLGLASDGTTLYVGDWASGDIWAVDEAGSRVFASGLAQPEGLALDGDRLLVVEVGTQQVTAIDLASGEASAVITGLDLSSVPPQGFLPFGAMSGVVVGPDGAIYVTDDTVNSVYRFER